MTPADYLKVKAACLICLAAAAIGLTFAVASDLRDATQSTEAAEDSMAKDVHALVLPIQKAGSGIASASLTIAQVGKQERDAFSTQQRYYADLTKHTDALLEDADGTLKVARLVLVPKVADSFDAATRTLNDSGDSVRKVAAAGVDGLSGVRPVLDALEADATQARPAIQQFAEASGHLNGVSANLETETGLMVGATKKALAPKNKVLTALSALFHGTITVAEFYYYISH